MDYLKATALAFFLAVIVPLEAILWAVFGLVCINSALGVMVAWSRGERFDGIKLIKSLGMALAYAVGLVATKLAAVYLLGAADVPVTIVAGMMGGYLVTSILRALGRLSGSPILDRIDKRIQGALKQEPPAETETETEGEEKAA